MTKKKDDKQKDSVKEGAPTVDDETNPTEALQQENEDLKAKIKELESQAGQPAQVKAKPGDLLWWVNVSGTFRDKNGKIRKPNERFQARGEDIPVAFRDTVVCQQEIPEPKEVTQKVKSATKFSIVHKGGTRFNVVNTLTGKIQNEGYLNKVDAQELLDTLS